MTDRVDGGNSLKLPALGTASEPKCSRSEPRKWPDGAWRVISARLAMVSGMPSEFDTVAFIQRFRQRAAAVRSRGVPPIEGPERKRFIEQAKQDFMDFAIIADAEATLVDGVLTLSVDLRPKERDVSDGDARRLATLDDRPIVLAGFMGVGKTSIGRLLARRLNRRFLDTDLMVEASAHRLVADMLRAGDEAGFREAESFAIEQALQEPQSVIALGGGALVDPSNREHLHSRAILVHLDMDWETIERRVESMRSSRPLLADRSLEEIRALFDERRASYEVADVRVALAGTTQDEAVEKIISVLEELPAK